MSDSIGYMLDGFQDFLFSRLGAGSIGFSAHLADLGGAVSPGTTSSSLIAGELTAPSYAPIVITPSQIAFVPGEGPGNYQVGPLTWNLGSDAAGDTISCWWLAATDVVGDTVGLWAGDVSPPFVVPPAGADITLQAVQLPVQDCATPAPPQDVFLFADNFFRNSHFGSLAGQQPIVGARWTVPSGGWSVDSTTGSAKSTSPGGVGSNVAVSDWGVSEAEIQLHVVVGANAVGAVVRFTDASNFWFVELDSANARIAISKFQAGVVTLTASAGFGFVSGASYMMEVQPNGDQIFVTLNGGLHLSSPHDSFNQGATQHGLWAFLAAGEYVVDIMGFPL